MMPVGRSGRRTSLRGGDTSNEGMGGKVGFPVHQENREKIETLLLTARKSGGQRVAGTGGTEK